MAANTEQAPRRRSVFERLSEADAQAAAPPVSPATTPGSTRVPSHLTDTGVTTLGAALSHDLAFRVESDGGVIKDHATTVTSVVKRDFVPADIDHHTATGHHLLLVADTVGDEEVEALAVSVWEGAGWTSPGVLRLSAGARLEGPWTVPAELAEEFGTSEDLNLAWVLVCPPMRGAIPGEHAKEVDHWARAFPHGIPGGVEAKMLRTMERMARRLAGTLRIAGSGALIEPDPDSAVSLVLCAPRWLEPHDLLALIRTEYPQAVDSRELNAPADISQGSEEQAERRRALSGQQVLDGYAVVVPVGNRSQAMVEVRSIPAVPQAMRWEPWARGTVIEYRLRWLPGGALVETGGPTRTARLERSRSAKDIESLAGLLAGAVGGSVIDEDGFLVALD